MKKVGRPAVSEKRKPRSFKATDTEWQAIQRMAAERGLSASEYIRNVTLGKEDDYMKNELKAILESGDVSRMKAVVKEGITNDKNCNFLGFCEVESPSDTLLQGTEVKPGDVLVIYEDYRAGTETIINEIKTYIKVWIDNLE